ncbi:MAG TPA: hypothetical protein VFF30_16220 [Nitrososphaerales archaeon]|nr:hypothetical protein [Nitrososphaerales archaeon]
MYNTGHAHSPGLNSDAGADYLILVSTLCGKSMHSACIGIDIDCDCGCHVSAKTLRRDARIKKSEEHKPR